MALVRLVWRQSVLSDDEIISQFGESVKTAILVSAHGLAFYSRQWYNGCAIKQSYFDSEPSRIALGYCRGGLDGAIRDAVAASPAGSNDILVGRVHAGKQLLVRAISCEMASG
jgi:hypothetical protein